MAPPTPAPAAGGPQAWPDEGLAEEYGLALSGGGIRAMLFHLGALWRLNELGRLRTIDRISSVSGGSFAAGLLALAWAELHWDERGRATDFEGQVARRILRVAGMRLDVPIILLGIVPGISASKLLAAVLDRTSFHGRTLQDLPAPGTGPRFVFNATDLATGTDFRFSRPYMGSYRLGLVRHPTVRIADAVAASASFPPFVSPFPLHLDPASVVAVPGADLHARRDLLGRVALADGGVYDNLALEPVSGRCRVALVSDAGGNLSVEAGRWKWAFWTPQLKRTLDIAVSQSRALRRRALGSAGDENPYAIWRTASDPTRYPAWPSCTFEVAPGWPEHLAGLSTRIWPFETSDRDHLVNWGYLMADLALRSFVWKDEPAPDSLPMSNATFETSPARQPVMAGGRDH